MSKKDEALKLALEAMTYADACLKKQLTTKDKHEYAQDLLLEAGTAIREALEQPAQPYKGIADHINHAANGRVKIDPVTGDVSIGTPFPQPAQQQEPVAVKQIAEALRKHGLTLVKTAHSYHVMDLGRIEAQTTSPPASKPWVGLTDEEYSQLHDGLYQQGKSLGWIVDQVEIKLREKNT